MTQLDEGHFHLHSANKDKNFQAKKTMKNMNDFHNNKSKIMLVDGDLLAYKITSSLEEPVDWGNDVWTLHSDFKKAKQLWIQSIAYYLSITSSKDVVVAFSDKVNFRKELDSTYKSHRKGIRKPVCYSPLRKWIEETHKCETFTSLEGDDVLGLLATGKYKDNNVIVSGDKDMRTIPTWHCFIIDDSIEYVDELKANYNFCQQVLVGDASDGYSGLKGCGAVKSSRVLLDKKNIDELWEAVLQEYQRNGYEMSDAYHQGKLARILRDGEYNYKTKQIILWRTDGSDKNSGISKKAS